MKFCKCVTRCSNCRNTYYGETNTHWKVRSGEHIGMSHLSFNKIEPSKESTTRYHHLNCNNMSPFEEFTVLANGTNKFVLKMKESLPVNRNRNILIFVVVGSYSTLSAHRIFPMIWLFVQLEKWQCISE